MKSLNILFTAPGKVELAYEELPELNENQVLCRTERSLISIGTETRCLEGKFEPGTNWSSWVKYPFHPGYDNTAVVLEVGSAVTNVKPGDRVASGAQHRQYFVRGAANVQKIPEGVDMADATWIDILRVAQNVVRKCQIQMGDTVVVIGQGPIGQMVTQFARICGAMRIITVDPMAARADLSWKSGATHVLTCGADEAKEALLEITGGKLADIVFDTTGYHKVLAWAVDLTRVYGKVGLVGDTVNPSLQAIGAGVVSKSISVIGAHGAMTAPSDNPFYPWTKDFTNEISMEYIAQKRIRCDHLVSHTVSPEQAPEIYEALLTDRSSYLGVVFDWSLLK